ncbi:MAG TPA: WXG100 family type VII secretion target [Herpetosiphon sp.]|uniref:WXG100 family type VII secretion target n=1 Tax=Herpetosiphon sp. TaxID=71864 RepID=UPI0003167D6A|nr:WXG100 family type VII secretion target [Herpetosiphon sp.]HBW51074.1 WXG100 family type VII secretion target [Herpetosiphon sp.]
MAPEIIQIEYETIANVAQRFGKLAADVQQLQQQLQKTAEMLASDWKGEAATAFAQEMQASIVPTFKRLSVAFETAQSVTLNVSKIFAQAEQEAANLIKFDSDSNAAKPATNDDGPTVMGVVHEVLDWAGFIPGLGAVPDAINAGLYAIEGDWGNAALSGAAAIPIIGDIAKGVDKAADVAKVVDKVSDASRAIDKADDAADAAKGIDKAADATKAADEAAAAAKAAEDASKARALALESADGGHSIARHGPEVSDQQLKDRLTTGYAPDGKLSPTSASTKFNSYQDWERTRQSALDDIAKRDGVDFSKPPAPGEPTRYMTTVDHGHPPIGNGFEGVDGKKIPNPNGGSGKIKVYDNTQPLGDISQTKTTVEWNPTTNNWDVVQHFPTK